ncbi:MULTISPECIES: methyl-accepting chemotaxis protein [unclassified Candidatus Frackibacter]|uniref:methyl-accepting chemotaxis protein n=1 Tax=unclassified Candidatus Frackibacter TaxID=2648818 RepID=UPI000794EAE8|nr:MULTISPECIES: methyl-accepting chemotaxis protein [unclassified Candidatus Frackibacter]KXS45130.1 MAG: methyl-accepting chemotaxis protein [Candidatus Frackibacter sp. T328-2]SDC47581.1 methyl-accepting chemotaxis sensory transducer with Cache sensor [Candidatus Frackibacter sp. WG11]SEM81145.1 methyl-accepting chemotaxis sensory transducer with Cache sensor [Candidatus Frackibacter sp. WG12]SFL72903.1 methyl-accepting chemotaxis sensory transducer with Cache sensor [Candidatus Frackibacter
MKKISSKIIIAITACSVFIALLVGGVSIFKSTKLAKSLIEDKIHFMTESLANEFNNTIINVENNVDGLATTIRSTLDYNKLLSNSSYMSQYKELIDPVIKSFTMNDKKAVHTYFYLDAKITGGEVYKIYYSKNESSSEQTEEVDTVASATSNNKQKNADLIVNENLEWYDEVVKSKSGVWSDLYKDKETGEMLISYKKPVYSDGQLVGVVGMDIKAEEIKNIILDMKVYNSGYAFLLNDTYDFLIHKDFSQKDNLANIDNGKLKFITKQMSQKNFDVIEYQLKGQEKIMGYAHLTNGNILGVSVSADEALQEISSLSYFLIGIIVLGTIVAVLVAWYLGNLLAKPIVKTTETVREVADGNLNAEITEVRTNDEVGQLANAFNEMISNFKQVIADLLSTAEDLAAYSEELSASAQEGDATIDMTNDLVEEMTANIQQISASAEEVTSYAQESSSKTEVGNENIENTLASMREISQAVNSSVEVINDLDSNSKEIGEIVELITDIAEQTNLLALNAAIEAARAGEAGKGFAVVAEEIRTLAEETNDATERIANLIRETQQKSDTGLKAIQEVKSKVQEGQEVTEEAGEVFKEIQEASEETAAQIQQTAGATQTLAQSSEEVKGATTDIQNMSNEITHSSQELANMAQKLKEIVSEFKL